MCSELVKRRETFGATCKNICNEVKVSVAGAMFTRGYQVLVRTACGLLLACVLFTFMCVDGAELVIEIPGGAGGGGGGQYRLEYRPPQGSPAPNFTVPARRSNINFQGLPGTKYHFMLYYSNDTLHDMLTWNQTIITAPEPPTNVSVTAGRNKQVTISWDPPANGDYTGFRLKVTGVSDRAEGVWNVSVGADVREYVVGELAPGATYQLHAFTLLHDKESAAYASRNFTTKPNTPGKFIVWFRNETTLLVLWQPPYPAGHYTHYKVSIVPGDARDSELYVEKEGEPPGPAQAAFKGLVPGRAYNISVQTVSEPEISAPTTAQYRTVPLRPLNVTPVADPPGALAVSWRPPADLSEFDKYQVSLSGAARRGTPVLRARTDPPEARFERLEPGATYTVSVKTMSGKVTSWPATADVTLPPLEVVGLTAPPLAEEETAVRLQWEPAADSQQDSYRVRYLELGEGGEAGQVVVPAPPATLDALLAGRNYSLWVAAVSRGVVGPEAHVAVATRPLAPVLQELTAGARWLRVAWASDVDSRQDRYTVEWERVRPGGDSRHSLEVRAPAALVEGLSPGAVYAVGVRGAAGALEGPPLRVQGAVRPLPPVRVWVSRSSSTSAVLHWELPPVERSAVGAVVLRYRTEAEAAWARLPAVEAPTTEADITDMTPGERYVISVETASLATDAGDTQESGEPLLTEHTVRPNPVSNVAWFADTANLTLEWPAPKGRVDSYRVEWTRVWEAGEAGGEGGGQRGSREVAAGGAGRVQLAALWPGARYRIQVWALSHGLAADELALEARTRPLIQSEMTLVTEPNGPEPAFLVVFTRTPATAAHFDHYRFRLEARGEPPREAELPADVEAARLNFTRLVPGRLYNLTMWTAAGNMRSHPVQRQARLVPDPVTGLNATAGPRHVALAWMPPDGDFDDFEVQWLDGEELASRATAQTALTVRGLRPHTEYTFTVSSRAGSPASLLTRSRATSAAVRTLEAPPEPLESLVPVDVQPTQVSFSWSLPAASHNGELLRFVLEYRRADQADDHYNRIDFPPTSSGGVVGGLTAGAEYVVRGWGETAAGGGRALEWRGHTALGPPPRPAPHAAPAPLHRHTTRLGLRLRGDAFSNDNGNLTKYALVVSETPAPPGGPLPGWGEVRGLATWPPYVVWLDGARFREGGAVDVVLGEEQCDIQPTPYCNGPLRPNTRYYVRLRGYTAPDKYTDTDYTVLTTEADHSGWWWGGGVLSCLCVCAVGGVVVRRRRRSRRPPAPAAPRSERPVRVADFIDHYRLMSADSDFRFSEEFEELKHVGRDQPCTAADLPCNRPKNRFTNILPYDHSRYKLQPVDDEEGSDYINANFVPGHNSPREFIVTQGPLHCTRDDFWRMCWESGSRAIVMLTRCVEKGREKCDRYWPYDTRPVYYGDICVTSLNESRYPDWTVTELGVARGAEQRVLVHFHFTTWPDFGVPSPPTTLARFVRSFRDRVPPGPAPVVVHCSAGVGRSGTFITLDRALQQLAAHHDTLDIFGMVHAMRRERVWMVQTEQQYICIHQCLVAVLEGQDLAAPPPGPQQHLNAAFDDDEGIAESPM